MSDSRSVRPGIAAPGAEMSDVELISAPKCYGVPSSACGWSRIDAGARSERLVSALEVERGGTRVPEGDPGNWAAVARVISDRVRELGWRQRELAERSHVSVAVVREIQRHTVERRRSPRTLEALSVALGWEPGHLDRVLRGHVQQSGGHTAPDGAALWSRLDSFESRLAEISRFLSELRSDIAVVIDHVRDDR